MNRPRTFVGFGFGPIQAGLFLYEAYHSGNFQRLVVAEVRPELVRALRDSGGEYQINIAHHDGIKSEAVPGVEIFNPSIPEDRLQLIAAVAEADEISTAVPSVDFYCQNQSSGIVSILAEGLRRKMNEGGPRALIYTAENHNHAAEILGKLIDERLKGDWQRHAACVNTVIGKMSGVISLESTPPVRLAALTPEASDAYLVEAFNRILIERPPWSDFLPGIEVFEQKPDLLPFEEAKLYGHNAIHCLLGFLLRGKGCQQMSEAAAHPEILALARRAFLEESGEALCRKHQGDRLFSREGFAEYAEDLLTRMLNPYLLDSVARVTRDPRRKLGWNDRLVGAMQLALRHGIRPLALAHGLAAAIEAVAEDEKQSEGEVLDQLWTEHDDDSAKEEMRAFVREFLVSGKESV